MKALSSHVQFLITISWIVSIFLTMSPRQVRNSLLKEDKPKSWYYTGNRKLTIAHARLRMKCSQLSNDLFLLNIIDSPKCTCGSRIEDATHYFLFCPLYIVHRRVLLANLLQLGFNSIIENILFGDLQLCDDVNKEAVSIIHAYIKKTNRF